MAEPPNPKRSAPARRVLLVLGQTPFPIELLDAASCVLYCNSAYSKIFLDKPAEVLDRPSRVFPTQFDKGRSRAEVLDQVLKEGLWKGEVRVPTVDQRELPVRLSIFPIQEPGGGAEEYAVFYEDITEELAARESLIHQQNLVAIRSRQAQTGELLSMIAHQWRQPLTVVMSLIGNIQLKAQLGAGLDPDYLKAKLERMSQSIQFLSETIDSFRTFHAPSRNRTEEDLVSLARKALDLVTPSLQKFKVKIEFIAPEAKLLARVYRGEFQQLVLELVNNAQDALVGSSDSLPILRIEVSRLDGRALLKVWNNGTPIPPEVLPRVFDPYYSTKDSSAGTGLGLYMVKTIVENHHGGSLTVESSGGWTCFTSIFPLGGK